MRALGGMASLVILSSVLVVGRCGSYYGGDIILSMEIHNSFVDRVGGDAFNGASFK